MDPRWFIIPIVLFMVVVFEIDNRRYLYSVLSNEEMKNYHSCLIPVACCVIGFFALMFFFPNHNKDYEILKEQHEELQSEYDTLKDDYDSYKESDPNKSQAVESAYDDANVVKWYFRHPEEVSKEEAEQSMHNLFDKLYPNEW